MRAIPTALMLALLPLAAPAGTEPVPFRLDAALDGRSFEFNAESFLHRWAYRLDFPLLGTPGAGFVGSAGSVRASEFTVDMAVRKDVAAGALGEFGFRWQRSEDLDGRYDQTWLGVTRPLGDGWSAALWGDISGDKEQLDARLELAWSEPGRGGFRVALVATDFQYNSKQVEAVYIRLPYTLFVERKWVGAAGSETYAFLDLGFATAWRDTLSGLRLDDERQRYGLAWRSAPADRRWSAALEGEQATRRWRATGRDEGLARDFTVATVQVDTRLADGRPLWFGVRGIHFDETWRQTAPAAPLLIRRREGIAYLGAEWRVGEHTRFRPELLLTALRNHDDLGDAGDARRRGVLGKLSLPFVWILDERTGASVMLMPSIKLHEFQFGGAAVQLRIPF